MAFDFKREYREFYMPKRRPCIVDVPRMNYIAVRGSGDPNAADGAYQAAIGLLYAVAFTIKMSKLGDRRIEGYFDFVVPPLEGFWWQDGVQGVDYSRKEAFQWISAIRLPDFVARADFDWAVDEASHRKKLDCSGVEFRTLREGMCVQSLHVGPYDEEPATIAAMEAFAVSQGYRIDLNEGRLHHEIYLSDARRTAPEGLKTVVRHPIRKAE